MQKAQSNLVPFTITKPSPVLSDLTLPKKINRQKPALSSMDEIRFIPFIRKFLFCLFFGIVSTNFLLAQTLTLNCLPDTTISTSPLLCTGTVALKGPVFSVSGTNQSPANALSFDGTNDYVSLGTTTAFNITNAITIEAWVKVNSFTKSWQSIVTKGDNSWRLHRNNNGNTVSFGTSGLSNTDLSGTKNINDGQWHHIAGVYNGTTKFLYVDGVLDASVTATGTISTSDYAALIGENAQQTGRQFHGGIDEVRIWNIARTQQQIQEAMKSEVNAQTGLVGLYHFNEGTAGGNNTGITTATDGSGNGIHGTLTNFALSGATSNWVEGLPLGKIWGNTLNFEGTTDFVSVNTGSISVAGSYTVEAYVKPSSIAPYYTFFSTRTQGNTFDVKLMNGNQIACDIGNTANEWIKTNAVANFNYSANTWYHIAVVVKPSGYTIYANGLEVGSGALANGTPLLFNNNGIITIGAAYTNATENFQGSIDEVRVWKVARTASEILSNMKVELNAQAGLVAAYHFNEGIAAGTNTGLTTTADASGNNLNGTLNNFARTGNTSNWVTGQSFDAKISGNAPATFPVGNTIVTWTATNGAGITATCNQTVAVVSPTGTQVVAQNNVLIADGDATPSFSDFTDFENVGSKKTFRIKNPSAFPLLIDQIAFTGTHANQFGLGDIILPAIVAPGSELSFSLIFAPESAGVKTATVNIATNNCDIKTYDFAIKAEGANIQTTVFNESGNYTPPPGVISAIVQAWGTGANGGSQHGGGGGAFVQSIPISLTGLDIAIVIPNRSQGANTVETRFGSFITAFGTVSSTGGQVSSGSMVAFSYKGGNGGMGNMQTSFWGGGGGGAAGSSGQGGDGQSNTRSDYKGAGGIAGTGGGNGGAGGKLATQFPAQNAGNGINPGGGGGGGNVAGKGANGRVVVVYTCNSNPGVIGNAHSVSYPAQLTPDFVLSTSGTEPTAENRLVYTWQQSTDNINWVPAKTPVNALNYRFDQDSIKVATWYRRQTNACNVATNFSNVVKINVVNPPNGVIKGIVRSKNGAAVKGITVYAKKKTGLPGSPVNWLDSAVTGIDGQYTISRIYYGDPAEGTNNGTASSEYLIWPEKLNHGFNPDTLTKTLSNIDNSISEVNFIDTTVFAITGSTYQECIGCLNGANNPDTIRSPLDSVDMYRDGIFATKSGYAEPPGAFGRYAVTVTDPGNYKIEPKFSNHGFSPVFTTVTVAANVGNIDFKDTTAYTISGKLTAGCDDYIGMAVLEFSDILPPAKNGTARESEFRKRVTTTAGTGAYSIILPARKYKVKIVSFSPKAGGDVQEVDLLSFFNTHIPKDSLVRDITKGNATLNIVYNRMPVLDIVGLETVCTTPAPFAIVQQGLEKYFTIKAYQGPVSKNCPAIDTTLFILTNIQKDDAVDTLVARTTKGIANVKLIGGNPNIIAPHFKQLNVLYTDANGFNAQISRNVVVTGLKSDIGSFATVSPEIPIMVLHDPPGDNSFSFWESLVSNRTAMRFFTKKTNSLEIWDEVKLGLKSESGVAFGGYFSTESAVWGSVKGAYEIAEKQYNSRETIISTTATQLFSTAQNDAVVGAEGDVFIGAALNLLYSRAHEVAFNPDNCLVTLEDKLSIANNGFATQYIYSEDHIRNSLIPTLKSFSQNAANTPEKTREYNNQIKVWEQTLANNEANKKRAAFDKNLSFDGAAGKITSSSISASYKSNSLEFELEVDDGLAAELGIEFAGSGFKGGININFKVETGESLYESRLDSTIIGYTLDDDDNGDFYSVNIKKDPVYNTPVFELVAATTSCPYEPGSQPRDQMQLLVPEPVKTGIAADGEAEFILKLGNLSQSGERRTYTLSFVQASNPNGAKISIGGSQAGNPTSYSIDHLGEVNILVTVKRGAANIFSYEGLQFRVTDACDGSIEKTVRISAFFNATCSPITLGQPEGGWVNSIGDNNIMPILFNGYTIANTTSVSLEYQKAGANNWNIGFTRTAAELSTIGNGTLVNWNVTDLTDGAYNLRMKLNCTSGVVNSQRASGVIDRVSPILLGKPEPTDDEFLRGDEISLKYNELLDCSGVTPSDVLITRMSNGQIVGANVGCFQNKIVIVPINDISGWTGDSIRVSVNNISDLYGNGKTVQDTWRFMVGKTVPATGPRALTLGSSAASGGFPGKSTLSFGAAVPEDAGIPINFTFELPANADNDMLINYTVSGNGVFKTDYNVDYSQNQNLATVFSGATGSLTMKKGTKKVELSIIPIPNQQFEPNKTITITLAEGGDYELGAVVTATGTILNDDSPKVYVFTGSGNFNVPANWDNNIVPPSQILVGDEVVIDPPIGGECILNIPVTVLPGAKFTVMPGKVLKIGSNLQVKKKL